MDIEAVTKAEFARRKGWSKPYVTKLLRQSRLVLTEDGLVDIAATEGLLHATSSPEKEGVRQRNAQQRGEQVVLPSIPVGGSVPDLSDFHQSRAEREKYDAGMARIKYERLLKETVERQPVFDAAYRAGLLMRDTILGIVRQVAPDLAAISDPWELERKLTTHLSQALESAAKVSVEDLKKNMD